MQDYSTEIQMITRNLSRVKNTEIYRKAGLMLEIMTAKNIRFTCLYMEYVWGMPQDFLFLAKKIQSLHL